MESSFAVIAEFATSGEDSKLTIGGIFDELYATRMPCMVPRMYLVTEIHARVVEGSDHRFQISIVDADGQPLVRLRPIDLIFTPGRPGFPLRARVIALFEMVSFPREGDYQVVLWVDDNHLLSLPIHVSLIPPPALNVQEQEAR